MMQRIPPAKLVDRGVYRLQSRNLMVGVWDVSTNGFIGIREKFGSEYLFEEYHHEIPGIGTVSGMEFRDAVVPAEISLSEYLGTVCSEHQRPIEFDPERPGWLHEDGTPTSHEDHSILVENKALFDLLKPHHDAIEEERRKEYEFEEQERISRRWSPRTETQARRDAEMEQVRAWFEAQREADTWDFRDLIREYQKRITQVYGE